MVSGSITKDGMSKSEVDPCGICSLRVMVNYALCAQCGKCILVRRVGVKSVTPTFSRNFTHRKCEGNVEEAVEQRKSYVMK